MATVLLGLLRLNRAAGEALSGKYSESTMRQRRLAVYDVTADEFLW